MQTIPLEQAEGHLVEIVEKLSPGEEVVLTRDSKPVARIVATSPKSPRKPRQPGTLRGTVLYIAPDFDAIPEGFEGYIE
jgi:antitoxin (DNA-binding transcriptional repressor) of toxin-antitoxin stability system